jgi:hypothetical protein
MLAYSSLPNTRYTRGIVGFFMIAGMSYCARATTLPEVVNSVVVAAKVLTIVSLWSEHVESAIEKRIVVSSEGAHAARVVYVASAVRNLSPISM